MSEEPPLSPRIGCMGQIKRDGDNKVSSSTTKGSSGKLNKLKKILSGKSFSAKFEGVHYRVVSIVELDPPLPVPKRLPSDAAAAAVSLWVRRGRRPLQPIKIHSPSQSQSQSQPSIPCNHRSGYIVIEIALVRAGPSSQPSDDLAHHTSPLFAFEPERYPMGRT
ncbi:hypothetical protein ACLOJK_013831 [Asimina triloba]